MIGAVIVSGFLLRIILNGMILFAGLIQLPGIFVDTLGSTLLGAAIIGVANAAIRPLMLLRALPFDMLTLAGVTLMINLVTPLIVVHALPGFVFSNVTIPFLGIVLVTICSCMLTRGIRDR